jgi:hypothetical protein
MDEIECDVVNPVDHYHWNTLSCDQMRRRLEAQGGRVKVWNIDVFLRRRFGFSNAHNPLAYTFVIDF